MAGDHGKRSRMPTIGDRNPRVGGRRERSTHPRHNFPFNTRPNRGTGLFASSAKNEGVAPFETDHREPLRRIANSQLLDIVLRTSRSIVPSFANVDALRVIRNQRQQFMTRKFVIENDVGLSERRRPANRDEVWITRTRPHKNQSALRPSGFLHASAPRRI